MFKTPCIPDMLKRCSPSMRRGSTTSRRTFCYIPTPHLVGPDRQQFRLGINRMLALAAPLPGLLCGLEYPVHRAYGAVISAFIEQGGVNRGGSDVDEALAVEDLDDDLPFGCAQREGRSGAGFGRHRVTRLGALAVNAGTIDSQRRAGRRDAGAGLQTVVSVHQVSSPFSCAVGRPSKVQSFFWTSMMVCARSSSPRRRCLLYTSPSPRD